MISSLAARIPPELFEYILQVLTLPDDIRTWSTDFVSTNKRELGRCALVNRYWAAFCQERIFRNIALRTHADLVQFVAFLECPVSRVRRYVCDVVVAVEAHPKAPWLHRLIDTNRKYRVGFEYHAELDGTTAETATTTTTKQKSRKRSNRAPLRSIHHALPKTLPSSESSTIRMLDIKNTSFRSFADLVHLLTELRALRDIQLISVTWAGEPPLPSAQSAPSKRWCQQIESVEARGCTADWVAAWMLVGLQRPELELGRAAQERCIELLASVQDAQSALASTWNECVVEAERYIDEIDYGALFCFSTLHLMKRCSGVSCRGRIGETEASSIAIGASVAHKKPGSFFLTLVVDISMTSFDELAKCDWASFDEYVRTHADETHKVVLGFVSQDDMKRFLADIVPRLPWLLESGKLAYAMRLVSGHGPQNDTWAYATLKEETVHLHGACPVLFNS